MYIDEPQREENGGAGLITQHENKIIWQKNFSHVIWSQSLSCDDLCCLSCSPEVKSENIALENFKTYRVFFF